MDMQLQEQTLSVRDDSVYNGGKTAVEHDVKATVLVKGEERYVFLYNEQNRGETLRLLGRFASNPDLSFTWYDAAVVSQKIRQESQQKTREQQRSAGSLRYVLRSAGELFQ
ncbi:MAG: hypothetical protein LBH00_07795 [Planctomycetaceae bacterium]|nr:hypothetical protein [Planctomycetaceae bacterium]